MWIIRWIFWVVVLLFIIYFATQNATQTVIVKFYKYQSNQLPLWVVMYISFAVGILVWLVGSIFKVLQLKNEVRKMNKENTVLRKELDELRNIPIEEETDAIDDLEGEI